MRPRELLVFSLIGGCVARAASPPLGVRPIASTESAWIAGEPAACGEVRGRVLDQAGEQPIKEAYVTLDSASRGVMTDSLGRFRLPLPHPEGSTILTRPAFLRVRRVGTSEIRVLLPSDFGYVVEVWLPAGGLHVDHLTTLHIKSAGFCAYPSSPASKQTREPSMRLPSAAVWYPPAA